jgi:hypothetical protein
MPPNGMILCQKLVNFNEGQTHEVSTEQFINIKHCTWKREFEKTNEPELVEL